MNILTKWLEKRYLEITPKEFYREIFPVGELDIEGGYNKGKYVGVAVEVVDKKKTKRHTITDGLEKIEELLESESFCITSPISYAGKSRRSENARYLYALAFDLDGIIIYEDGTPQGLIDLFYQINGPAKRLPLPTMVVSSGTGLHLYYVFEEPIPLFRNIVNQLRTFKHELTRMLWHGYITRLEDNVQQESVFQGFRMVGTKTKTGDYARAFVTGERVTLDYLNGYVEPKYRVTEFAYKSRLTKREAKQKYPEWYRKRIEEKQPKGHWKANRAVYDWWKKEISIKAKVGHRYYCMMMLAVYARKCGVSQEELEQDAFLLMDHMEQMTDHDKNHFDEADVMDALEAYHDRYVTYPINSISYLTDIEIKKNKRNGRKQAVHLKYMNGIKLLKKEMGEIIKEGRPKVEPIIREYMEKNPKARKVDIIRETGLSKPTVYKYYDDIKRLLNGL